MVSKSVLLVLAAACLMTAGCSQLALPVPTPVPSPTISPATAALTLTPQPGMTIGLNTTSPFGALVTNRVDPTRPGEGMRVTIREWGGGRARLEWRKTTLEPDPSATPEPTAVVGVGTPKPVPTTRPMRVMNYQGQLTVTGLEDSRQAFPLPLSWEQLGTQTTGTAALWLSKAAYAELAATRQTRWSPEALLRPIMTSATVEAVQRALAGRRLTLQADGDFQTFDLLLDGAPATVRTIVAHDDLGDEVVVLANPDNPLILRYQYHAASSGTVYLDDPVWAEIQALGTGYQVLEITR